MLHDKWGYRADFIVKTSWRSTVLTPKQRVLTPLPKKIHFPRLPEIFGIMSAVMRTETLQKPYRTETANLTKEEEKACQRLSDPTAIQQRR